MGADRLGGCSRLQTGALIMMPAAMQQPSAMGAVGAAGPWGALASAAVGATQATQAQQTSPESSGGSWSFGGLTFGTPSWNTVSGSLSQPVNIGGAAIPPVVLLGVLAVVGLLIWKR